MEPISTKLLLGDSLDVLKTLDANSVDLIFTSPPYV
ncbi:MAG: site-specific DNA-methyltransferase, partial [Chlorobiales bacterium]|nr:site-specific DNA-methyltransferase [Chlorobiales bacterium]